MLQIPAPRKAHSSYRIWDGRTWTVTCCGVRRNESDHTNHIDGGWSAHVESALEVLK